MDETKTDWFQWIARNAHQLCVLIWGVGLGAFGAVICRLVDAGGDGIRTYIAVLTLLMAGALGLASSRAMDHYTDQRSRRRKVNLARLRIQSLLTDLGLVLELVDRVKARGEEPPFGNERDRLTSLDIATFFAVRSRAFDGASEPPEFDDFINDDKDITVARLALHWFRFVRSTWNDGDVLHESEATARKLVSRLWDLSFEGTVRKAVADLTDADVHFSLSTRGLP